MTAVTTAIDQTIRQFSQGVANGNAAAIAGCYGRDARLLPPHSDAITGSGDIERFWQGALDLGITAADLQTQEVEEHGDTAVEVGTYRLLAQGGAVADTGKYIVIWKRQDGAWKMYRDIWNSSQPAPAAAGA